MPDKVTEKELRKAYIATFKHNVSGQLVLKDLENHCFKRDTTVPIQSMLREGDTIETNEGKRQVLLHIESMMSKEGIESLAEEPEKGRE